MAKCAWCKQAKAVEAGYCETCLPIVKKHRKEAFRRLDEIEVLSQDTVRDDLEELGDAAIAIVDDLKKRDIPYDDKKIHGQLGRITANCGVVLPERFKSFWVRNLKLAEEQSAHPSGVPDIGHQASAPANQRDADADPKKRRHWGGLYCPKCKGSNITLLSDSANVKKVKNETSLNLNPVKPFTVFNHKQKVVEKKSGAKVTAAVLTGGMSLMFTGTKDKRNLEVFCQDCGHRWKTK